MLISEEKMVICIEDPPRSASGLVCRDFTIQIKYGIINYPDFCLSNEMFKAGLTNIKRTGKGTTQHKGVISDADIATLYSNGVLNRNNLQG